MRTKSASIGDVARVAGVSTKTVSRVINNEPNVTEGTKEKVLDAIKSLGYTPSISARTLASNRSYCVNLICRMTRSDYIATIQSGAMTACQARGYHFFVSLIGDYLNLEPEELRGRLMSLVSQPRPDCVILPPPFCDDPTILRFLTEEGIAFVRISPHRHEFASPYVYIDERRAAYDLTRYLIGLGHLRIAHIKGNPAFALSEVRAQGYEDALAEAGIEVDPSIVLTGDFHFLSGLEAGNLLCAMSDPPTAIFASNDEMAAGVSVAAHRAGLSIPDRLSIVGFDDAAVAELTWPALTTVRQPVTEMAMEATNLAIDWSKARPGDEPPEGRKLDYSLVVRDSAARPSRVAAAATP